MPMPESWDCLPGRNRSIWRHYRTFIKTGLNFGIDCGSACESVTISYLNANHCLTTRIACEVCQRIRLSSRTRPGLRRFHLCPPPASRGSYPMPNARKILIVDDDTDLRDTLVEQLSLHEEFEASAVDTGAKGASAAKANSPDLVLMDVGLPDTDGREVVRSLRKGGFKAPIIMLTGHDTDSDTILGLESGANDYVAKPFRFAVLLARIRAQLRQHEASEDAVFSVGPYSFRPGSKML